MAEIWRVPPGASNPECESCRKPDCPELTTSGPTSVPILGKPVMFSLSLSGNIPADLRFKWTTSKGRIVTGQGTKSIQIMPPWEKDWRLVVTIDVIGLPFGCTASAVEIVMPGDREHPVLIDEFDITPDFQDPYRLNTALAELNVNPADHLFVVLFHPNSESPFVLGQVIKLI